MALWLCGPLHPGVDHGQRGPWALPSWSKDRADLSTGKDTAPSHRLVQKRAAELHAVPCMGHPPAFPITPTKLFSTASLFFSSSLPTLGGQNPNSQHHRGTRPSPMSCLATRMELGKVGGGVKDRYGFC